MVPLSSLRISRVRTYFGYCRLLSCFPYKTLTFFGGLSHALRVHLILPFSVHNPKSISTLGLASFAFARRYSGNRCFFLFLALLRCFSSGGSLHAAMYLLHDDWSSSSRVSPFGYRRISGYLLLPAAFRSLSRPSSAPDAKASTLRSFSLDLTAYSVTHSVWFVRIMLLVLPCGNTSRCLDISFLSVSMCSFQGTIRLY